MSKVLSNIVLQQTIELTIHMLAVRCSISLGKVCSSSRDPGPGSLTGSSRPFPSLDRYGTWIRTGKTGVNNRPLRGFDVRCEPTWSPAVLRVYLLAGGPLRPTVTSRRASSFGGLTEPLPRLSLAVEWPFLRHFLFLREKLIIRETLTAPKAGA